MSSFGMIKEGWLTKCGGGHKSWKKRWFILQDNLLYYFQSQKDMESKGTILLSKVAKIQPASSALKKKNCFEIVTSERSFPIQAETENSMKEWMDAITTISNLHALRETYKNREHHMTDGYRMLVITLTKKILGWVAKITGITKGLGGKHKWSKGAGVDPQQLADENAAIGNACIALANDALASEKDPYKEGPRKQLIQSAAYLRDITTKMAAYAEGGPNEAALKSTIKLFADEVQRLLDTVHPTPKKEVLHLMKSMAHQIDRYIEAGNADQRAAAAKKLEVIALEFPTVTKSIYNFIPDLTYADPLVQKAETVPQITKDVRELVKNAAFFSDSTSNASNATHALFLVLNEIRKLTMEGFPKEEGDAMYPQVGPANVRFPEPDANGTAGGGAEVLVTGGQEQLVMPNIGGMSLDQNGGAPPKPSIPPPTPGQNPYGNNPGGYAVITPQGQVQQQPQQQNPYGNNPGGYAVITPQGQPRPQSLPPQQPGQNPYGNNNPGGYAVITPQGQVQQQPQQFNQQQQYNNQQFNNQQQGGYGQQQNQYGNNPGGYAVITPQGQVQQQQPQQQQTNVLSALDDLLTAQTQPNKRTQTQSQPQVQMVQPVSNGQPPAVLDELDALLKFQMGNS